MRWHRENEIAFTSPGTRGDGIASVLEEETFDDCTRFKADAASTILRSLRELRVVPLPHFRGDGKSITASSRKSPAQ
jgi:hypothetical protein